VKWVDTAGWRSERLALIAIRDRAISPGILGIRIGIQSRFCNAAYIFLCIDEADILEL